MDLSLTDEQRHPLLGDAGRRLMQWMTEHPNAPRFNHRCGDRLDREGLDRIRRFDAELRTAPRGWGPDEIPRWVRDYSAWAIRDVPMFQRLGAAAHDFASIPTCSREDLGGEPWSFVPNSTPLDDLIVYETSGTTGHPLFVLSHPDVSSMYLATLQWALDRHGVRLDGGSGRVSIILVCAQNLTFTYASISSWLGGAGFVKLNLNPYDWKSPEDRASFIDDCQPEVITGDPVSFLELAKLPLRHRPKALVSTAMALLPGMREELESRFGCPVIDVYSMNESRFIGVRVGDGYEIVPHDLFVEILDSNGRRCPTGERGEITITGGRNRFLPLLRYRTGDYGRLDYGGREHGRSHSFGGHAAPRIVDLEGRPPILLLRPDGRVVNTVDVSFILKPFALAEFHLHQRSDISLVFRYRARDVDTAKLDAVLRKMFPPEQPLELDRISDSEPPEGKVLQYTSDLQNVEVGTSAINFRKITWQEVMNP